MKSKDAPQDLSMDMKQGITIIPNQVELEKQFEHVNSLIEQHRSSAIAKFRQTPSI